MRDVWKGRIASRPMSVSIFFVDIRMWGSSASHSSLPTISFHITRFLIMLPVLLSVITRALVTSSDDCFGGVETFERLTVTDYVPGTVASIGVLLQQENVALTRDCINLCKQQQRCSSFTLDFWLFRCMAFAENTRRHREHVQPSKSAAIFEKVCLKGIAKQEFDNLCGNERLWAFERVNDAFLDAFVDKELNNMIDREECAKACLMETSFICRSADFDEVRRICRLSKENRRTQPQAFVQVKDSKRDYLENQCAPSGPASCVYTTRMNTNVYSMDSLQFAGSADDCQLQCDREISFTCRSFGFHNNRCMLSADDQSTIGKHPLTVLKGALFGERTCVAELCTNGIFTYEKVTGHVLRSAIASAVELPNYSSFGVTGLCRESCDMAQLNCPAFTVNYQNNRCERLDRNTQGRLSDLIAKDGESYFEKICLRVPQIMSQCQDKFWAFERVLGYELAPVLYVKTLSFVQSRRDCQEYCLQEREFPCRSALYNDETTECRLSPEDRRTSPGFYYRSRSIKLNYLENQCVRVHSACPYVRTTDTYPTYTDIVETNNVASSQACEKMCNDNRHFLCRSYAYYPSNGQCFLSGDDSVSAGSVYMQKRSSIMYYERQCPKLPSFNTTQPSSSSSPSSSALINDIHSGYTTETNRISSSSYDESGASIVAEQPSGTSTLAPQSGGAVNKEIVIMNGTVGGIITTRITRFPESLLPTVLPPQNYPGSSINNNNGDFVTEDGSLVTYTSPQTPPFNTYLPSGHSTEYGVMQPPDKSVSISPNSAPFTIKTSINSKCGPNARFLFEKVTTFEPIGGHLTLLYSDLQNPGIVTECARRCEHSSMCRAFVVDYYHQSCHGLFENSSVGSLDLRLSMGKDYFEGFCVPNHVHCSKFWPFDRIIDQATVGSAIAPQDIVRFISRAECRTRCLEERKFRCLSASYNSFTHECHLFAEDRNSGNLNLQFNKGVDFMENQCMIDVKLCRYHSIERDISIVSVTKSIRGTSTFHCEQACDYEKEFNCRSYTYLDNPDGSVAPGGNLCLLSADNRATSHQGSMQFRPRALYAEKDCAYNAQHPPTHHHLHPLLPLEPENSAPKNREAQSTSGRLANIYKSGQQPFYQAKPLSSLPANTVIDQQIHQDRPSMEYVDPRNPSAWTGGMRYGNATSNTLSRSTKNNDGRQRMMNQYHQTTHLSDDGGGSIKTSEQISTNDIIQLQHIPAICSQEDFTFEKTFGYDLRYARRERAPIPARPGVAAYCKEECVRMGERCRAFVLEYGPEQQQSCYFLGEAASENRNQLNKISSSSYIEKICLREKACGKMWSFERIIGFTLDEPADKEMKSIMLRTACQDLCLAEKSFPCRAITFDYGRRICRLFRETRRSKPYAFKPTADYVDYFENKCANELTTCQYRDFHDRYFIYADRIEIASSLIDCQRHCDSEQSFHCKSVNFDSASRECALSSEDSLAFITLNEQSKSEFGHTLDANIAPYQRDSIFSEKGNCEQVSVQCNQQDMMLTLNFESPFYGRVYTKSNPSQCNVNGNGQTQLHFSIPINSRCGTHQESTSNYVNEIIVQQHSVIMTDSDRTIRVLCSFEVSDQTITLGSAEHSNIPFSPSGIDVSNNLKSRSYGDRKMSPSLVTNTAPPPSIVMRILDHSGNDAQVVNLGDELTLRIELKDRSESPFAMFARNLYARSSSGESLFLIDNNGCPLDSTVFGALELDPVNNRSLYSRFKAFRFPTTGVVNFEVQIRFCQEFCEPIKCAQANGHVQSFGRRRRSVVNEFREILSTATLSLSKSNSKVNDEARNEDDDHHDAIQIVPASEIQFAVNSSKLENILSGNDTIVAVLNTLNPNSSGNSINLFNGQQVNVATTIASNNGIHQNTFDSSADDAATREYDEERHNLTGYTRIPSHKTGFAYPSSNYRYYGNRDLNLNEARSHSDINNDDGQDKEGKDSLFQKHNRININFNQGSLTNGATSDDGTIISETLTNKNNTVVDDDDDDRALAAATNKNLFVSDLSVKQLLPKSAHLEWNVHQSGIGESNLPDTTNYITYSSRDESRSIDSGKIHGIDHSIHSLPNLFSDIDQVDSHYTSKSENIAVRGREDERKAGSAISGAVLPLPTVTTEVPLSLAIMVDDANQADSKSNTGMGNGRNEFDYQTPSNQFVRVNDNRSPLNQFQLHLNYADMAKLEKKNDRNFAHGSTSANARRSTSRYFKSENCSEECGGKNMGFVIFLTTLVVTVLHLTLASVVYLYLRKVKQNIEQRKSFHPNLVITSRLNSLTPSTASSISSFGRRSDDTLSLSEDTMGNSSYIPSNLAVQPLASSSVHASSPNGAIALTDHTYFSTAQLAVNSESAPRPSLHHAKPNKWFGMTDEQQQQQHQSNPQQHSANLRSAFNRENVFFGPREQRFLGINTLSDPLHPQ